MADRSARLPSSKASHRLGAVLDKIEPARIGERPKPLERRRMAEEVAAMIARVADVIARSTASDRGRK